MVRTCVLHGTCFRMLPVRNGGFHLLRHVEYEPRHVPVVVFFLFTELINPRRSNSDKGTVLTGITIHYRSLNSYYVSCKLSHRRLFLLQETEPKGRSYTHSIFVLRSGIGKQMCLRRISSKSINLKDRHPYVTTNIESRIDRSPKAEDVNFSMGLWSSFH